jgi:hypothetical protein
VADTKNWREVRRARALNEARVETYRRLMDAVTELSEVSLERGVSEDQLTHAFAELRVGEPGSEQEDDLYLSALTRCVAALGGHVEVRAVFGDDAVTVLRINEQSSGEDESRGD